MGFATRKDPKGVVGVEVDGQLIVGNRQEFKQRLLDALEGCERKFVVDFARTGYIDSSGLGVLVSLSKKIRDEGGDLRLAGLRGIWLVLHPGRRRRRSPRTNLSLEEPPCPLCCGCFRSPAKISFE